MKLKDLEHGQLVLARLGRAGEDDIAWDPWQHMRLFVQRHDDKIVLITTKDIPWAEYTLDDFNPESSLFTAEDYYMQIKELEV